MITLGLTIITISHFLIGCGNRKTIKQQEKKILGTKREEKEKELKPTKAKEVIKVKIEKQATEDGTTTWTTPLKLTKILNKKVEQETDANAKTKREEKEKELKPTKAKEVKKVKIEKQADEEKDELNDEEKKKLSQMEAKELKEEKDELNDEVDDATKKKREEKEQEIINALVATDLKEEKDESDPPFKYKECKWLGNCGKTIKQQEKKY